MSITIRSFDCGAKPISRDFRKTLKADKYPDLEINFISLQNANSKENIKGVVDITLAGSTARHNVCYYAAVEPNGGVLLRGIHEVHFADFRTGSTEQIKWPDKGERRFEDWISPRVERNLKNVPARMVSPRYVPSNHLFKLRRLRNPDLTTFNFYQPFILKIGKHSND
jgi:hypothetical protein